VLIADEPDRTRRNLTRPRESRPAQEQAPAAPPPTPPAQQAPAAAPPPQPGAPSAARDAIRNRTSTADYTANPFPNARENFSSPDRTQSGLRQPSSPWRGHRQRGEWTGRSGRGSRYDRPGSFDNRPGPGWQSRYDQRPGFVDEPRYVGLPSFSGDTGLRYTNRTGAGLNWTFGPGNQIRGVGVTPQSPRYVYNPAPAAAASYGHWSAPGPSWGYGYQYWSPSFRDPNEWRWNAWFDDHAGTWSRRGGYDGAWSRLHRGDSFVEQQSFFFVTSSPDDVFDDDDLPASITTPPTDAAIATAARDAERERQRLEAAKVGRTNPRYDIAPDFFVSIDSTRSGEYSLAVNAMRRAAMVNAGALVRPDGNVARALRNEPELQQRARYALSVFRSPPLRVVSDADARFMVAALSTALGETDAAREAIRGAVNASDTQSSTTYLQNALNDPSVTAPNPWIDGAPLKK
jgi:hypothetical protein